MRPLHATLAAVALVVLNVILFAADGARLAVLPYQLLIVGLALGPPAALLTALLPAIVFLSWSLFPRKQALRVSRLSITMFVIVAGVALGTAFGLWGWGPASTAIIAADVLFIVGLVAAATMNIRRRSAFSAALFHWLLLAWIATYAFPYSGDLP